MTTARVLALALALGACDSSEPRHPPPAYPPYGQGPYPPPHQPPPPPPNAPPRSNDDISRVVNAAYPSFTECYRHSESYMTGKSGNVTIFFDIAPHGNVIRATGQPPPGMPLEGRPLADAKLTECLVNHFHRLGFPVARDETAASWLFTFAP